jgi:hypothetical protein
MVPPYKSKKKKGKDGVGQNKVLVQEKTLSPITQNKEELRQTWTH